VELVEAAVQIQPERQILEAVVAVLQALLGATAAQVSLFYSIQTLIQFPIPVAVLH
jgi:hypothetical protein